MIEDENTSPSERAAVEARVEERQEELAKLRTQIQERDLPLRGLLGSIVSFVFRTAGQVISFLSKNAWLSYPCRGGILDLKDNQT